MNEIEIGHSPQNLRFSISYDSSWASAPIGLQQGVAAAINWLSANVFVPTTIRLLLQFAPISANAESFFSSQDITSGYAEARAALVRNARSGVAQMTLAQNFPASDPFGGATITVPDAQMRLLGLWNAWPAHNSGQDSQHIFNSGAAWFYGRNGNPATDLDAFGVAMHEISEGAGRFMNDTGTSFVTIMEYLRWKAAGQRQTGSQTNVPSYCSLDGGVTTLNAFNTASSGDPMDWHGATTDCFNAAAGGGVQPFSLGDKQLLDAIGFSSVPNPP